MSTIKFDPSSFRKGGQGITDAADDLKGKTHALLSEVSDLSALGTNDTLGSLAQVIYGAVLERVRETVDAVCENYGEHGGRLATAAKLYEDVERGNTEATKQISTMSQEVQV